MEAAEGGVRRVAGQRQRQVSLVVVDPSVWACEHQAAVARALATAIRAKVLAISAPLAAAAESVDAELWHCDRHFELIAEVTGQRMRRVGT